MTGGGIFLEGGEDVFFFLPVVLWCLIIMSPADHGGFNSWSAGSHENFAFYFTGSRIASTEFQEYNFMHMWPPTASISPPSQER